MSLIANINNPDPIRAERAIPIIWKWRMKYQRLKTKLRVTKSQVMDDAMKPI